MRATYSWDKELTHKSVHKSVHKLVHGPIPETYLKLTSEPIGTWFRFVCLLVVVLRHSIFQLYHGGDIMHDIRSRKSEPTLLLTQRIFNHPHHICMVREKLFFDDAVSYTKRGNGLQHS